MTSPRTIFGRLDSMLIDNSVFYYLNARKRKHAGMIKIILMRLETTPAYTTP